MNRRTVWLFQGGRVGELGVSFGWQILAARLLLPAEFGLVAVATAVATFVIIVASLGGDELVGSAPQDRVRAVFHRELTVRIALGAILTAGAIVCWLPAPLVASTLLYSACLLLSNLLTALSSRLYRPLPLAVGVLAQAIALVVGFLLLKPTSASLALMLVAVSAAVRFLAMLPLLFNRPELRDISADRATIGQRASLVASGASGPLLGRQIHVTLAALLGVSLPQIAAYSIAYSLAYTASTVTILGIGVTALPRMADAAASADRTRLASEWRSILLATSTLSIPVLFVSAAVAPALIGLLFGAEYAALGAQFYIGLAGMLVIQRLMGGGATNALLIATGQTTALVVSILIALVAVVAIDFALLPTLGMWGAIVASVVSTLVSTTFTLVIARRTHGAFPPFGRQVLVLLVSATAAAAVLALDGALPSPGDFVSVGVGIGIGLVCLLIATRLGLRRPS